MYAVTGITGQVGGALARALLAEGEPVRAVVRDAAKGRAWAERGCEVALADMRDAAALTAAFTGATGVFVLLPPTFDPSPGFPEAREVIAAVKAALTAARPARVVCISTIGAQAAQPNLLNQLGLMEQALGELDLPIIFLRPAWFMENFAWDVASARERGAIDSYLQPLDKPVPMIATADVGRVAARLLTEAHVGPGIVELEAAQRFTPNEVAASFARILGRPVEATAVPRETWGALFKAQGMNDPIPRIQMLDGFNEGWIAFEGGEAGSLKGEVSLETVLRGLVGAAA